MKRLLSSLLVVGILFSMTGCGQSEAEKEKQAQEEKDKEKYNELKKSISDMTVPEGANEEEITSFNTKKDEILKMIKDKKDFSKIDDSIEELDKLELDINVRVAVDKEKKETEENGSQQDNSQQTQQTNQGQQQIINDQQQTIQDQQQQINDLQNQEQNNGFGPSVDVTVPDVNNNTTPNGTEGVDDVPDDYNK